MDDGWPARWPPPPPPPPQQRPSAALAPAPTPLPSHMDSSINLRYHLLPFAAGQLQEATAAMPEQLLSNPWSSLSGQPGRAGPSSQLLAQGAPGNYHHLSHVRDLKALLDKPSVSNAAGFIDLTRASPLGGPGAVPLQPNYPKHGLSAGSSVEHYSLGAFSMNKSSNAHGTLPGEGSANNGMLHGGLRFQDSSAPTMQKLAPRAIPRNHPMLLGDRIRVSCLNVGGEFFMGEAGIFGVLCLCHQLRMSVAKFCEHAGGPTEKAGEIVHMENGMSIAQWFRYCVGVGASIADNKWDWPEWACMYYSPEGYRLKSLLASNSSVEKTGLFSGYGKITGAINRTVYSEDLYNEGRGCSSVAKLVNKRDETYCKKNTDVHTAFTKNYASLQNSEINLGLVKNHTISAANLNPVSRSSGSPSASMGGNYTGNHLAHNYANLLDKSFDVSFHNPVPSSTGVFSYDSRACTSYSPNKILQDSLGIASNTELKLGQSSYHQSMTSLFPLVQSTTIDFQKPQSYLPLITQNPCTRQTTKVHESVEGHTEPPFSIGNKRQSLEVANGISRSEGDEITDDASKNSFISLFLSHLQRNSESIDDILNSNEHNLPKALDGVYCLDHSKSLSRQVEPRANNDRSKLASTIIPTKKRSDGRSLSVAPSGYVPQAVPLANCQEPLIQNDCLPHLLLSKPNAGISKKSVGVSCLANCRSCNNVGNISHQVAHVETGAPFLYDEMARGHSTCECVDDLCTHKSLRVAKISCQCGKSCVSSREFLPAFGQNDQSTLGKPIHRCCCKVQEVISELGFRAGDLCRTHFSNVSGSIHKPTVEDELCTCSTFIPRSSLCSREHILQSSCHGCPLDGCHYRSSLGHVTNSLTRYPLLDARNNKEPGPCRDGRCHYSVVPKCLAGCGLTKHCDVIIDQSGSTVQKSKHDVQMSARGCTLGDRVKLICQCSSNGIARSSNAQTSFSEDVSNTITNQPYVPISERLKNVSEESGADGSWPYGIVTERKGSCRGSGISKEQLKSGFSFGSSCAAVTKFSASPELNNISSCTANYGAEFNKVMLDEGSRTEKCSSSSYAPISTGCEKALSSFHLDISKVKRKCRRISDGNTLKENDNEEQRFETRKKSRTLRCSAKRSEADDCTRRNTFQSSQNGDSQPQKNEASTFSCRLSKTTRKHTTMQLNKPVKRLHSHHKILKDGADQLADNGILVGELNHEINQVEDMTTLDRTKHQHEGRRVFVRKLPKYVSLNCIVDECNGEDSCSGSASVASSLSATGITNDNRKFPKIVPLNLILKKAKRCHAAKPLCKTENVHFSEKKSSVRSVDRSSFCNTNHSPQADDGMPNSKKSRYSSSALRSHFEAGYGSPCSGLGEGDPIGLTDEETSLPAISALRSTGVKNRRASLSVIRIKRCEEFTNGSACNPCGDKQNAVQACEVNVGRYKERLSSDDLCCVCEISDLEPCNQLIECSKCYIKVHQACYGVLKVPKGQWLCRPCKTNKHNTVCVLCGYGGGAMTRALKTQKILKSLLKGLTVPARSDKYVHSSGNARDKCASNLHGEDSKHDPFYAPRSTRLDTISTVHKHKSIHSAHEENAASNWWTTNHKSSLLGPRTMQWVHVVCGLWTPGTKCPNSTTMSAFDLSGASPAKGNTACSICNRTGGSFMECRDINCSVLFHPWCAHQRGSLQSEPEGEHNENIGFYGRCLEHAVNPKKKCLRSDDWTCARTEGFKGRKGEGWPGSNYKNPQENSAVCSVSQEQINAWLHINRSKPCIRGPLKGRKHLVVYKSGIHGLGLYTSELIPRGSMVIEYVGEIIGQPVADKREVEYHSGKRPQYKSACYFFKIDKEHIIDATRKGGIARFINHSCLVPNCVAEIISVGKEKKVVFFSERHINPGEEITYDYHFNQEDEGQRIPCFCRSRSCRRYLN